MKAKSTVLCCGLGGGLDVVNASILYHLLKSSQNVNVMLGSVRPRPLTSFNNVGHTPFHEAATVIHSDECKITSGLGRYVEPRLSSYLQCDILYFCRSDGKSLRDAVLTAKEKFGIDYIFFVDGGGDSLVLRSEDCNSGSETTDPFKGGDAELITAVNGIPDIYQAVIAVGLDIDVTRFNTNLTLLKQQNAYFGRVNLATGSTDDYNLAHIFELPQSYNAQTVLRDYFTCASDLLVLQASHQDDTKRMPSHTATVTYHALRGEFGQHRTFVSWEPVHLDGTRGPIVKPSHQFMYFFDITGVDNLKKKLNGRLDTQVKSSSTLEGLPPNATMRDIFDYCVSRDLPSVAQGMIEVDPPAKIIDIAEQVNRIQGENSVHMYRSRAGEKEYLEGVVNLLVNYYKMPKELISTKNVFATQGVTGACVALFALLLQQKKSKIGIVYPFYTYHLRQIYSVFGDNHPVEFIRAKDCDDTSDKSMIDFEALERDYLQSEKLDCLIICNPGNPSTLIWSKEDLNRLALLCLKYDVMLLVDECYCDMVWINNGQLYTPLFTESTQQQQQTMLPNVVVARGFSKNLGCQSWRVGYAIAHESLIAKMVNAADPIYICVPWLQHAMGKYLQENLQDFANHLETIRKLMRENWVIMRDAFVQGLGWKSIEPQGSMYGLFLHNCESDMEAVQQALSKQVGVTPCNIFFPGTPQNTNLIRIHCGISKEKAERIAQGLLGSSQSK